MHLIQIIIISFTEAVHQISIKIEVVIFWDLCMHGHFIAFFVVLTVDRETVVCKIVNFSSRNL